MMEDSLGWIKREVDMGKEKSRELKVIYTKEQNTNMVNRRRVVDEAKEESEMSFVPS